MESFLPTPVVPSNAPLWPDTDQDSHILREQCGNRQLGYLQTQHAQDYYTNINDDSTCGSAGSRVYQSLQFGRARPGKPHFPWMAGLAPKFNRDPQRLLSHGSRGRYPGLEHIPTDDQAKDQEAERKARLLASKFLRCDGYIKYRNRQPKEKKGGKEDAKWPDHIEDTFIIGSYVVQSHFDVLANVICYQLYAVTLHAAARSPKLPVNRTTMRRRLWEGMN